MKMKTLVVIIICLFGITTVAAAVDLKPGMWEHTVRMEMPGMPFTPPPTTMKSCMDPDDTVPGSAGGGQQHCSEPEVEVHGNTVNWTITCRGEGGSSVSKGSITYSNTTYKGEATVTTQGRTMTSKMSGRYVGPCN